MNRTSRITVVVVCVLAVAISVVSLQQVISMRGKLNAMEQQIALMGVPQAIPAE